MTNYFNEGFKAVRLLLIHQNLPGQYRHLLSYYGSRSDCQVVGLGETRRIRHNIRNPIPGVKLVGYDMPPVAKADTLPLLRSTEAAVRRGEVVIRALVQMKKLGFTPDVVYAHPGWGETLFLKDVFPKARLVHFCEFYYQTVGQDFNFDPEFPSSAMDVLQLRMRNLHHLMSLEQADVGVSPTEWQKTRFPQIYQPKISVVHDGVDTKTVKPDPEAFVYLPQKKLRFTRKNEVITFVSRNLEPYRGFHTFMRAVPDILRSRPNAHIIIVGGNEVSYGRRLSKGTYREKYLLEIAGKFDTNRVHFVGKLPYKTFLQVLQVSTAHIYLTYPFVLSWSMMEAMAAGCLIIGSKTAPVEEVITHGKNGLLVNFFSSDELVQAINGVCDSKDRMQDIRERARQTIIDRYDLSAICLPRQRELLEIA